jgi:hypothetical protein
MRQFFRENIAPLIADCYDKDLPEFKTMKKEQRKVYLENWFGCDGCRASDHCNLVEQNLPSDLFETVKDLVSGMNEQYRRTDG